MGALRFLSTQWIKVPGLLQLPGIRANCVSSHARREFVRTWIPRQRRTVAGHPHEREGYSFCSQFQVLRGGINYIPQRSQSSSCCLSRLRTESRNPRRAPKHHPMSLLTLTLPAGMPQHPKRLPPKKSISDPRARRKMPQTPRLIMQQRTRLPTTPQRRPARSIMTLSSKS